MCLKCFARAPQDINEMATRFKDVTDDALMKFARTLEEASTLHWSKEKTKIHNRADAINMLAYIWQGAQMTKDEILSHHKDMKDMMDKGMADLLQRFGAQKPAAA
jgi:Lon protease-like protein